METQGTVGGPLPEPPLPQGAGGVDLKVSKRLLWVGEAAYPLHNITRVHTFVLRPKRGEAVNDFLKWAAVALVVYLVAMNFMADDSMAVLLTLLLVATLITLGVRLAKVWTAPNEHVLAVETSSASTALVTLPNPAQLRTLVDYIVNAIEHPEAEFEIRVEKVLVNPRNYHFGDTVNMYGGLANTGIVKN
ncbi:DUF6232 family protein [Streptomyces sp. NPDC049687]|uniref:DUF6232 family protein n=1 Tax=Streptomyces sp. NPDC049687 TaxID=3365596 RepID=UPI00378D9A4E